MHVEAEPLDASAAHLREVALLPADVLPLFVAEMDYPLAPAIAARMHALISRPTPATSRHRPSSVSRSRDSRTAAGDGASTRRRSRRTTDVSVGIVETLRRVIAPGDGIVITSPVYAPFFELVTEAGGARRRRAAAGDTRTARSTSRASTPRSRRAHAPWCSATRTTRSGYSALPGRLRALADIAARHGATVVSDEIHGPLVHAAARVHPVPVGIGCGAEWG